MQSQSIGVNPLYVMVPCTLSASFAFMLPVATPPNAIVFSYGYLKVTDMVRAPLLTSASIGTYYTVGSMNNKLMYCMLAYISPYHPTPNLNPLLAPYSSSTIPSTYHHLSFNPSLSSRLRQV